MDGSKSLPVCSNEKNAQVVEEELQLSMGMSGDFEEAVRVRWTVIPRRV